MYRHVCPLCELDKDICRSHALPDSAFRALFRSGSGKAVTIVDDQSTKNAYSSDSWWTRLLCCDCEADLNDRYDNYGIGLLNGRGCDVKQCASGVTFSGIDRERFRMFVLSVVWRMAISPHHAYEGVVLPYEVEAEILLALRKNRNVRPYVAEVGVCRLAESSGSASLSDEGLRRMIVKPFRRSSAPFHPVCFLLFGFVIEVFAPRPPRKAIRGFGMACGTSPVLFAPTQEVAFFPEVLQLLVRGLDKHEQGLSTIRT
jgi:hypothetical protein